MTIIATHPVFAMHFCGGELYSLKLYQADHDNSCCMMPDEANQKNDEATSMKMDLHQSSCCDFDTVEVSTDDFQHHTNATELLSQLSSIENNWFTINDFFALNQLETNITCSQNEFPTKGLFMEDVCILSYICIYRI